MTVKVFSYWIVQKLSDCHFLHWIPWSNPQYVPSLKNLDYNKINFKDLYTSDSLQVNRSGDTIDFIRIPRIKISELLFLESILKLHFSL